MTNPSQEQDWERWAREVCTDYRIPFDNHTVGKRMAIVLWMADHSTRAVDKDSLTPADRELLQQALEALEDLLNLWCSSQGGFNELPQPEKADQTITALQNRLGKGGV